jgi:hypothetical protein
MRARHLCAAGILLSVAVLPVLASTGPSASTTDVQAAAKIRVSESYGRLPLSFEANQGQTDPEVKFLARGPGYTLFLTPTEAVLALRQARATEDAASRRVGANSFALCG